MRLTGSPSATSFLPMNNELRFNHWGHMKGIETGSKQTIVSLVNRIKTYYKHSKYRHKRTFCLPLAKCLAKNTPGETSMRNQVQGEFHAIKIYF